MSAEFLALIVGLFMPVVVEYVKKLTPGKTWLTYLVSLGISLIVGVLTVWVKGQLLTNPEEILGTATAALAASQSVYIFWFKNSDLAERIAK